METTKFEQLLLKTAFCCMASDGDIDKREVATIKTLCEKSKLFNDFDLQKSINQLVNEINTQGKQFIQEYFDLLSNTKLSEEEELTIINFALKTINADEVVEYAEIKFFKNIRHRLKISNENILAVYPDIADYLEEDIRTDNFLDKITKAYLTTSNLPQFEIIDIAIKHK